MIKELSHEDYIQWKAGEWDVTEEEARRIIEKGNQEQMDNLAKSEFLSAFDEGPAPKIETYEEFVQDEAIKRGLSVEETIKQLDDEKEELLKLAAQLQPIEDEEIPSWPFLSSEEK